LTNCCSQGTVFHFSLQSSHLNICYYHQDTHHWHFHACSRTDASQNLFGKGGSGRQRRRNRVAPSCPPPARNANASSYTSAMIRKTLGGRRPVGSTLERHQFSGLEPSAGMLLHTSERFPTSMATVRLSKDFNTFCGVLDERAFGHLKARYWFSPRRKCTLRKSARLGPAIRSERGHAAEPSGARTPPSAPSHICGIKHRAHPTYLKFENR